MLPHSDTLSKFQANQSLHFLRNAACLAEEQQLRKNTCTNFIAFGLTRPGLTTHAFSTTFKESTLTITLPMKFPLLKAGTLNTKQNLWCLLRFQHKQCSVHLYLQLFVRGIMYYCAFFFFIYKKMYSGVQHIMLCFFLLFVFVLYLVCLMLPVSLEDNILDYPFAFLWCLFNYMYTCTSK